MRENIGLFRGKRIDNGEWVEGYLLRSKIKERIRYEIYVPFTEEEEKENEGHFLSAVGGIWHKVDPDTIGECTGLKANGKLIFEGDIVEIVTVDEGEIRRTTIKIGECLETNNHTKCIGVWCDFYDKPVIFPAGHSHRTEVIGNIHDNPELLKGGEEE